GQVFPGPRHTGDVRLATQLAVGADLARHAGHLRGKRSQLLHHRVEGFLQVQQLAPDVYSDLLGEVTAGDRGRHLGDVADLGREVAGHEVHAVGQVLPGSGDAGHLGLAAQLAFGSHFAGHASYFAGESVELVYHRVDGVLELQDLAFHV